MFAGCFLLACVNTVMSDLITLDRLSTQLAGCGGCGGNACDDAALLNYITAVSETVENYTRRSFKLAIYDEFFTPTGRTCYQFVRNPPIIKVNSIRTGQQPGIYILNTDSLSQTQAATVDVTATSVILTRTYDTVTTTTEFEFDDYPTFTALGAAINALGDRWSAVVPPQFALWGTADLSVFQGTWSARNCSLPLCVYYGTLSNYKVNGARDSGEIYCPGGFTPGYQNYRISYLGGFATIPEDLQGVVAELVVLSYRISKTDPTLLSETLDKYSYTRNTVLRGLDQLSPAARMALNSYKLPGVARWK